MRMRDFGATGRRVSVIGLGGMPLSLDGRPGEEEGVRVVHAALDAGMRLIDTADVYCIDDGDIGHNERLVACALTEWSGPRDEVLVATKGGIRRPKGAWTTDGRPAHLRAACERSLAALAVDRIAVYQLHAPDSDVPFAETVGELARLRDEGKVEHVGLSNVSLEEIEEARAIVPIASVQNRCNPYDHGSFDNGVVARCEALDLAFLPYSPVGGWKERRRLQKDPTLTAVGEQHDASPFEVALAWLLTTSPAMIPIPGASKITSAESSARAAGLALSPDDLATIDAAVGFTHRS